MGAREDAKKRLVVKTARCSDSEQPNKNCSNYSTADISYAEWLDDAVMYGAKYANERLNKKRTSSMDNKFEYGQEVVHGYKAFHADWTCMGKQYTCPGIFHEDGPLIMCERGMHFCEELSEVFSHYEYTPEIHVCEVIGMGQVERGASDGKCCCTDLVIVRELTQDEIVANANLYDDNNGVNNTGHRNTGNWNTGKNNSGHRNTGDYNTGDYNTGDYNTGSFNTADGNSGCYNTGSSNTGDFNTGAKNVGRKNTGRFNVGSYNTGSNNHGNFNVGSFNVGDHHAGWFNAKKEPFYLFDKPCPGHCDKAYTVLQDFARCIEVYDLAQRQGWWDERCTFCNEVVSLPNFDPAIFKKCTDIDARKEVIEVATCTKIRQDATIADGVIATMKFPDGHEIEMLVDGYKADQKEISVWVK